MSRYQREQQRQARAREQAVLRARREVERSHREYLRATAAEKKEQKRIYVESRSASVDAENAQLVGYVQRLETLLRETLPVDDFLDLEALKTTPALPRFDPGSLAIATAPPELDLFIPPSLVGVGRFVPGARAKHEESIEEAKAAYERALVEHGKKERIRERALERARTAHADEVAAILARAEQVNQQVDDFKSQFAEAVPEAVVEYFSLVLDASGYPDSFPNKHRVAFVPESKQLVVEHELPTVDVVPRVRLYKYVKARDAIEETPRPASQIKPLYAQVVAQIALRTLHELFEADRSRHLETIVFNGYVDTIDPATGKPVKPHLVSLRTTREMFLDLDLAQVDPLACLKGLSASVSRTPTELAPVRPVVDFDMVDPRFIQESEVIATLDQRPNLMELSPTEFEGLIRDLFEKMGLETKQTQASRDGGVDCIAFDNRPIFGGKVVIQAKRYKHTVGVSAVRDLFGTLQNEGASKGILVTTSGYGKASFEFAQNKPLELLDGTNLLYLLAEHAGIEARIEPPDDWIDPAADIGDEGPVDSFSNAIAVPSQRETLTPADSG